MNTNNIEEETPSQKGLRLAKNTAKFIFKPREGRQVVDRMRKRTIETYNIFAITINGFSYLLTVLCTNIITFFATIFNARKEIKQAAKNNFKLGLIELKEHHYTDAKLRFMLSNIMYNKSATTKYYIAYVFYLEHKFNKALKYINEAITIDQKHARCIALTKRIEEEMKYDAEF